jgi:hypothetical protein
MLGPKFRQLCGAPLQHLLGSSERYYPVLWSKLVYDTRLGGYVADIDFSKLQKAPSYRKGNQPESPDQALR